MTKIRVAAVGALAVLALVVAGLSIRPSRAQEPATARVSNVSGRLAVRGGQESAVSYLQLNSVVGEGDTLWTDTNGQAEVELPRGAWFRLAQQTKVEVLSLRQTTELRLWQGSLYCQVKKEFGRVLTVRTPDGDVAVRPGSVARIEMGDQAAGVRVYFGEAEVLPLTGTPVTLARGQRCRLESGRLASSPEAFDTAPAADTFDQYQSKRAGYLATYREPSVLRRPLIGSYELAGRGDWVRERDRDYWIPDQEPGWRPYSDGYWSYVEDEGPVWVDDEPWGYTTSHYGRWDYLEDRESWGWVPDDDWGPNYVAWGGCDDDYVGWAPLGPDDPYDGWSASYADLDYWDDGRPSDRWWTFCPRDDFYYSRSAYDGPSVYLSYTDISYGRPDYRGFRPYRDFYADCGAPLYAARGLTVDAYGYAARDTVLRVERRFPRQRYGLFEDRFGFAPDRDLRWARDVSPVERYQRFRGERFADADLVRGSRAARLYGGGQRQRPFWNGGGHRMDRITNLAAYTPAERQFREARRQSFGGERLAGRGNRFLGDAGRPFNRGGRAFQGGRQAFGGAQDRMRGGRGMRDRFASLPVAPDGTRRQAGRGDRLNGFGRNQRMALGGDPRLSGRAARQGMDRSLRSGLDRTALRGGRGPQRDFGQGRFAERRNQRAATMAQRDFGRGRQALRQGMNPRQALGGQRGRDRMAMGGRDAVRQRGAGRALQAARQQAGRQRALGGRQARLNGPQSIRQARQPRAQRPDRSAFQRAFGGGRNRLRASGGGPSHAGFNLPRAARQQARSRAFDGGRQAFNRPQRQQTRRERPSFGGFSPRRERPSFGGFSRPRREVSRPAFGGGGESRRQRAFSMPSFGGGGGGGGRRQRSLSMPSFGGGGGEARPQRQRRFSESPFGGGGGGGRRQRSFSMPSFGGGGGGGEAPRQRSFSRPSFGGGGGGGGEGRRQRSFSMPSFGGAGVAVHPEIGRAHV